MYKEWYHSLAYPHPSDQQLSIISVASRKDFLLKKQNSIEAVKLPSADTPVPGSEKLPSWVWVSSGFEGSLWLCSRLSEPTSVRDEQASSCSLCLSLAAWLFRETRGYAFQVLNGILSFSSVLFSRSVVSDSLRPHESQHAKPPCPSPARTELFF